MADRHQRYEDNVQGRWYQNIICSVCAEAAPSNFKEALKAIAIYSNSPQIQKKNSDLKKRSQPSKPSAMTEVST